jgi:hypothetical protein
MGKQAISYRLAPGADSLQAFSPCRLRQSFYEIILPHLFSNVKHFLAVILSKVAKTANCFLSKSYKYGNFINLPS